MIVHFETERLRGSVCIALLYGMAKQLYFRGIRWVCEEGHENVYATSMFRISRERLGCIIGTMSRGGVWCKDCGAMAMPKEVKETVRLEAV